MIPYHIGVVQELTKAGVWVPGTTRVAGTSGGSYIATAVTSGTTAAQMRTACATLMQKIIASEKACVQAGGSVQECSVANGKMGAFTLDYLDTIIPRDPKKYKKTNNKAYTHITVLRGKLPQPEPIPDPLCSALPIKNLTIGVYSDRNDLIAACRASSFYSHVSHPNCSTIYRGQHATDGGYTVHLPCPPSSKHCLKIEALINDPDELEKCKESGEFVPGGSSASDIYPGLGTAKQLPMTPCDWQLASINATLQYTNFDKIIQQGSTDTLYWLRQNGWA